MARTWRIGEVAERTGLTRRTLRHYDDLGLLSASERSWGDYRLYTEADLPDDLDLGRPSRFDPSTQIAGLGSRIADAPKSLSWRLRAKVGERVPWYEEPEEEAHD